MKYSHVVDDLKNDYNILTPIKIFRKDRKGHKEFYVKCKCICGVEIDVYLYNFRKQQSCGCIKTEKTKERNLIHDQSNSKEYRAWTEMKRRCTDPSRNNFKDYGGRGISVCERWLNSFENFLEDMGYSLKGYSLDRIDVNDNYYPENCRWATASEQQFNKRLLDRNTSGKTGVKWSNRDQIWEASIGVNKVRHYLGRYVLFEDAVKAREEAELKYYGETK